MKLVLLLTKLGKYNRSVQKIELIRNYLEKTQELLFLIIQETHWTDENEIPSEISNRNNMFEIRIQYAQCSTIVVLHCVIEIQHFFFEGLKSTCSAFNVRQSLFSGAFNVRKSLCKKMKA